MKLIQIRLPRTKGEGVLHLTTDEHCYAQVARDVFKGDSDAANIFNNANEACDRAMEAVQHVNACISHLGKHPGDFAGAASFAARANDSTKIAEDCAEAVSDKVQAVRARVDSDSRIDASSVEKLFAMTVDAAKEARDAAAKALSAVRIGDSASNQPTAESLHLAHGICRREEELINKAKATIAVEERLKDEYDQNNKKMVLVIGGGVSGLMTAWILLDKGYRVTIVAEEWRQRGDKSPDKKADRMTSQIAGALWEYPPGGCGLSEIEVPVLAYSTLAQYRTWALQSFLFYKLLAENDSLVAEKNRFGARMITLYQFFQKLPAPPPSGVPNTNDTGSTADVVTRRAEESARGHHDKWKEIEELDTNYGDFYGKLKASRRKLQEDQNPQGERTQEADPEWKKAKNAIKYGPNDFNIQWGYRHQAPVVDTDVAMEFLMNRVRDKGATLETRHIREDLHLQERELMDDFKADIIVNASGLGAKVLASDNQVFPVRGAVRRMTLDNNDNAALDGMDLGPGANTSAGKEALVLEHHTIATNFLKHNAVLLPAQYDTRNQPGKTVFIVPRNEKTTVVGSIIQRNNWDLALTLESPEVEDMWKRAHGLVPALQTRKPSARPLAQGLRPFSHSNVRVSADNRTASCRVVHNYGHGGSGWTLAVGCAWTCVTIVERMLHRAEAGSVANANVWGLGGHRGAD